MQQLAKLEFEDLTLPSVRKNDIACTGHELSAATRRLDKLELTEQKTAQVE